MAWAWWRDACVSEKLFICLPDTLKGREPAALTALIHQANGYSCHNTETAQPSLAEMLAVLEICAALLRAEEPVLREQKPTFAQESTCQCRRCKTRTAMQFDPWVWKIALEKEMATHSSLLAWRILWTEEPCRLQAIAWQRVRPNWTRVHNIYKGR